eukprot:jgi/Astpho2/9583/Aster-03859
MLNPESPESSDSEESWTHVQGSEPGHGGKPLPHESHVVPPESGKLSSTLCIGTCFEFDALFQDQGQGSSEGASLLLSTPPQTFEPAQLRGLLESPPGTGLNSRDREASKPEECAQEGGGHSSSRWLWRFGSHNGPTPSPFADVAGDGADMQEEEAEGNLLHNDGQDGDGHSEGSGDTPVMVHGTTELEGYGELEREAREFRRASMTAEDIRRARQPINPAPRRTHTYMKIMLVGGPGLGKTTFMKMLQQQVSSVSKPYEEDERACLLKQRAEAAPGEYFDIQAKLEEHFVANHTAFSCVLEHVDGPFSYTYTLQDMPGLLAFTDCPVAHVRDQLAAWRAVKMADEEGPDPRVDVCLYFMSPEGLRAQDVEMMAQLSRWTSVVPIIARADSLAPEGLTAYRKQVVACLEEASTEAGRKITWTLPEALRATVKATAGHIMPPFAIISSTTFDEEFGSFWPVRHFAWGTAAAMNTEYSDLPMLRDLLFNVGLDHVKRETNTYYSMFCNCQPDEAAPPTTNQVARGARTCSASRPSQGRRPTWWRRLRLKARPLRRWATVVGLGVLGFWAASATVAALHNGRALAASRMELERHQADTTQVPAFPQASLLAPPAENSPSVRAGQVEEVNEAARLAAVTADAAPARGSSEVWADVAHSLQATGAVECKEATPLSGSNKRNAAEWGSALLRTSLDSGHSLAQMADRAVRERALPAVTGSAAVVGQAVMGGSREAAAVSRNVLQRAGRD